jgi:copper chaperone
MAPASATAKGVWLTYVKHRARLPGLSIAGTGTVDLDHSRKDIAMATFRVEDMTCGRCAAAITQAVQAVDAPASVNVDIGSRLVHVDGARIDSARLASAIEGAGYHPLQVEPEAAVAQGPAKSGGCCCGTARSCS